MKKNYEIDMMKLLLALSVFLCHSRILEPPTLLKDIFAKYGWFSVHFFFMISGMFMAAHYFKAKDAAPAESCGRDSLSYVLNKVKGFAPAYYSAFFVDLIIFIVLFFIKHPAADRVKTLSNILVKSIPEALMLQMSGVRPVGINNPTWYISAMLIAMLPMYFIMRKKPDFFFYILSPLLAFSLFGFFYRSDSPLISQNDMFFIFSGGFLRAVCGMSFGVLAYLMGDYFRKKIETKRQRIWLTAAEVGLIALFAMGWLRDTLDSTLLFPWSLCFPVLLAVVFSGKSYISKLFESKLFSRCGAWSLWIYLNHYAGLRLVNETGLNDISSYKLKLLLMAGITLLSCAVCLIPLLIAKAAAKRRCKA